METVKNNQKIMINNLEFYYKYIRSLMFDNLLLILVLYFVFVKFTFDKENNKFNPWIILYVSLIMLFYFLLKLAYRRFIYSDIRINDCMDATNQIIVNKLLKPIESRKELLDRPIKEFIINSSHNTYIPCYQNIDGASSEAVKRALVMGARVIELDVYARNNTGSAKEDIEPVVAHGMERGENKDLLTTSYIPFDECIDTIATYGFLTSDPLILCIENNTNKLVKTQERMAEIIKNKLGDRILSKDYKITTKEGKRYFVNEPIRNFFNKIIIIAGGGNQPVLEDLLDGTFGSENFLSNGNHKHIGKSNNNFLQRVYPDGDIQGNFSLNYDPEPYWKQGFQMVTLNFGTVDTNLLKNANKFRHYSYIPLDEVQKQEN